MAKRTPQRGPKARPRRGEAAERKPGEGGSAGRPGPLLDGQDRFIAAWGQMGSTWGISRTMAEAHALLYITGQPLCTDEVMERLKISRGNASMSLRALLDWGIIRRASKRGDRKEYFEAEQDVWTLLKAVVRER
ncbi:MAG: GbsR/MarR family transcriptional regulator, partial [Phycisphaerales bacterium]